MRAVTGLEFSRVVFGPGSGPSPADRRDASIRNLGNLELGRPFVAGAADFARVRPAACMEGDVWTTSGPGIRVTGVRISNRTVSGVVSSWNTGRQGRVRGVKRQRHLSATRGSKFQ